MTWLDRVPWWLLAVTVLTLGLAPYVPEPHVWEKLKLLFSGGLTRSVDIFDLALHGTPWLLLILKLIRSGVARL